MKSIDQLRTLVEQELLSLKYPSTPADLYAPIDYILSLGGKRMRPILLLLSYQLYKKDIKAALRPAIAIEVFHNFTLLHDDIMDEAPVRRGQSTVHTKWNENVAILSGDAMLIQSYQYLSELPKESLIECLSVFNTMALKVCEGQQYDMDFEIQAEVDLKSYLKMIEYKTAVLLGASLKMGAIMGGADKKDAENLYEFGRKIGIAFQLKDDLLDIFGDTNAFGKQLGGDIIANKKTCLYLKALSLSDGSEKMELVNLYSSETINSTEKVEKVKQIYASLEIETHINALINEYYENAMKSLSAIDKDILELEKFAALLKIRES
ncbi:MAG: polyprenyl synthetase family protein [Flavobacteriales bacterium]|nr:polyprenyl synthetase family protein [Flavobacteriales bacterium]MBL6872533.1 polyprenyl synthetase family protein [Flavobacteriales bacterium]